MASNAAASTVSETSYDLLLMEIDRYYTRAPPSCTNSSRNSRSSMYTVESTRETSLEAIGVEIGRRLAERHTRDRMLAKGDHLEAIKFICKDFWLAVFKKQIDNLRTNHRGVFVLADNNLRALSRMPPLPIASSTSSSSPTDLGREESARAAANAHLYLPCGIIRGALLQLGISGCAVEADLKSLPACTFTIRIL